MMVFNEFHIFSWFLLACKIKRVCFAYVAMRRALVIGRKRRAEGGAYSRHSCPFVIRHVSSINLDV